MLRPFMPRDERHRVADETISALPLQGLAIVAGSIVQTSVSIAVEPGWTGEQVGVDYSTLSGCQPKTQGHALGLWQGSIVNWAEMPPSAGAPVPVDQEDGSVVLDNLTIEDVAYTVGYAVGPDATDFCASATFSPGGQMSSNGVSLAVNFLGPTSLSLHFVTLPGYDPAAAGNWVGLWKGQPLIYSPTPPPLASQKVTSDSNEDDIALNGVPIAIHTTYTVVYYVGAAQTTAAAQLTFTTAPATAGEVPLSQVQEAVRWRFRPATPRIS